MRSWSSNPSEDLQADILLVTTTSVEAQAVFEAFSRGKGAQEVPVLRKDGKHFQDFGTLSTFRVMLVQTEMGSVGPGASQQSVQKAIAAASPKAVICVGIAFGVDETRQRIGDVLVSTQIAPYELQRVGTKDGTVRIITRGDKAHASSRLIDWLRNTDLRRQDRRVTVRFGLMVSGEKLVDNRSFRDMLLEMEPEALGGEMEAAGIYAACHAEKVDWIIVKAICDWADGNKEVDRAVRQEEAARNAAALVLSMFDHAPREQERRAPEAHRREVAEERSDPSGTDHVLDVRVPRQAMVARSHGSAARFRRAVAGLAGLALIAGGILYHTLRLHWIHLERDYVHLGDARMSLFLPPLPSGIAKTYRVTFDEIPSYVEVRLKAKDVDPDPDSGPFEVLVNGIRGAYVNDAFGDVKRADEHTSMWRDVRIRGLNPGLFRPGDNEITLIVPPVRDQGSDDVNYQDLAIGYR